MDAVLHRADLCQAQQTHGAPVRVALKLNIHERPIIPAKRGKGTST